MNEPPKRNDGMSFHDEFRCSAIPNPAVFPAGIASITSCGKSGDIRLERETPVRVASVAELEKQWRALSTPELFALVSAGNLKPEELHRIRAIAQERVSRYSNEADLANRLKAQCEQAGGLQ